MTELLLFLGGTFAVLMALFLLGVLLGTTRRQ